MAYQELTLYLDDDTTVLTSFSTDPSHPRPYLKYAGEIAASQLDLIEGKSVIGQVNLELVDKRTVPTDQRTGIFTGLIADSGGRNRLTGRRAVLRNVEGSDSWLLFDGIIGDIELQSNKTTYRIILKDIRERERARKIFLRTETTLLLPRGVVKGYGKLPDGSYLIPPTDNDPKTRIFGTYTVEKHNLPFRTNDGVPRTVSLGYIKFDTPKRYNRMLEEENTLIDELMRHGQILITSNIDASKTYYTYGFVVVRWRPRSGGAWHVLRDMPVAWLDTANSEDLVKAGVTPGSVFIHWSSQKKDTGVVKEDWTEIRGVQVTGTDLPTAGQQVEVQVIAAGSPSETTPLYIEETFGSLLKRLYDGQLSQQPLNIRYDQARMAELVTNTPLCRAIITEPVDDLRAWTEEHIYKPLGLAPAINQSGEIYPISYRLPELDVELVELNDGNTKEDASWSNRAGDTVNRISFTYKRDFLRTAKSPDETNLERFQSRDVIIPHITGSAALVNSKEVTFAPATVRELSSTALGETLSGSISDELGDKLAKLRAEELFDRYEYGGQRITATCRRSDPDIEALKIGDWTLVSLSWLPDLQSGIRGGSRLAQVISLKDVNRGWRQLELVDAGPDNQPCLQPTISNLREEEGQLLVDVNPPAGVDARVDYAISPTLPETRAGVWTMLQRTSVQQTLVGPMLPPGQIVWVRARGEARGRRPSAWTAALSLTAGFRPIIRELHLRMLPSGRVEVSWVANEYAQGLQLRWALTASQDEDPAAFTDSLDVDILPGIEGSVQLPALLGFKQRMMLTVSATPYSGFSGGLVAGQAGRPLVQKLVRLDAVYVAPTVKEVNTETATTGTLLLEVDDPQGRVTRVEFKTQVGNAPESAWSTDTAEPYQATVALVEKHLSHIAYRVFAYNAAGVEQKLVERDVPFDIGSIPERPRVTVAYDETRVLTITSSSDSDAVGHRVAVRDDRYPTLAEVTATALTPGRSVELTYGPVPDQTVVYVRSLAYNAAGEPSPDMGQASEFVVTGNAGVSGGPELIVTATPGPVNYVVTYSGDDVWLSQNGGAFVDVPDASTMTVPRPAAGELELVLTFRGTKGGQPITDTVVVPPIGAGTDFDTVTPDLEVTYERELSTAQMLVYTVEATNPRPGGDPPALTMLLVGCTAAPYSAVAGLALPGQPIGSMYGPTDNATLYVEGPRYALNSGLRVAIFRPSAEEPDGLVSFTASLADSAGGRETQQRSIPPRAPDTKIRYVDCAARIVSSDKTTTRVQVTAAAVGTQLTPRVELLSVSGSASLNSGPALGVTASSGQEWVFNRGAFGAGAGAVQFRATLPGFTADVDEVTIEEQGRDTVHLVVQAKIVETSAGQVRIRVAVVDPFPQGTNSVTITPAALNIPSVQPGTPQQTGNVTADLNTTGAVDFIVVRPPFATGTGRVTFTATAAGRVSDSDAVDVPAIEQDTQNAECLARITNVTPTDIEVTVTSRPSSGLVTLQAISGAAALLTGAAVGLPQVSGSVWTFRRGAFGTGQGQVQFQAAAEGYVSDNDTVGIEEQGRDTVPLTARVSVVSTSATSLTVRVTAISPYQDRTVTIAYAANPAGLSVAPPSDPTFQASQTFGGSGFRDYVISRPQFKAGTARVTFTLSATDRAPDTDAVDVPAMEQDTIYAQARARIVATGPTTVTVQVDAAPPTAAVRLVEVAGSSARIGGSLPGVASASGTQWIFSRGGFQAGPGQATFEAAAADYVADRDQVTIPEQGRDTVPLIVRAQVIGTNATSVTARVAVADPFPQGFNSVSVTYAGVNVGGVSPGSGQFLTPGASLDTTGSIDFVIQRPAYGTGTGRVTFTANAPGRVSDSDSIDVPAIEKDTRGPRFSVAQVNEAGASCTVHFRCYQYVGGVEQQITSSGAVVVDSPTQQTPGGAFSFPPTNPTWNGSTFSIVVNRPVGAQVVLRFYVTGNTETGSGEFTVTLPLYSPTTTPINKNFTGISSFIDEVGNRVQLGWTDDGFPAGTAIQLEWSCPQSGSGGTDTAPFGGMYIYPGLDINNAGNTQASLLVNIIAKYQGVIIASRSANIGFRYDGAGGSGPGTIDAEFTGIFVTPNDASNTMTVQWAGNGFPSGTVYQIQWNTTLGRGGTIANAFNGQSVSVLTDVNSSGPNTAGFNVTVTAKYGGYVIASRSETVTFSYGISGGGGGGGPV